MGDLQVDNSDAQKQLNWQPIYSVEQGIKATVDDFMQCSKKIHSSVKR